MHESLETVGEIVLKHNTRCGCGMYSWPMSSCNSWVSDLNLKIGKNKENI